MESGEINEKKIESLLHPLKLNDRVKYVALISTTGEIFATIGSKEVPDKMVIGNIAAILDKVETACYAFRQGELSFNYMVASNGATLIASIGPYMAIVIFLDAGVNLIQIIPIVDKVCSTIKNLTKHEVMKGKNVGTWDVCPECGDYVDPEWNFCPYCDTPALHADNTIPNNLSWEEQMKLSEKSGRKTGDPKYEKCWNCGFKLNANWRYCPKCNARVGEDDVIDKELKEMED